MPWLQWHLPEKENVVGITISTPSVGGELLRNMEIRAGTKKLEPGFRGKISENILCGKFTGPGGNRRAYTITCESNILADFITIQMLEENSQLQINELELVTSSTGRIETLSNFLSSSNYSISNLVIYLSISRFFVIRCPLLRI